MFNCVMECEPKSVRAVCDSTEKRAELEAISKTKHPMKENNYKR